MEKKVRYSHQRERIYQYLLASIEHPSAEMVYQALRPEIQGLSLGTVYRNLNLLEDLGKVRGVTTHQGSERYDAICGDHVLFICQGCGTIRDITGLDTEPLRESIPLNAGYEASKLDLVITGHCPRCTQQVSN